MEIVVNEVSSCYASESQQKVLGFFSEGDDIFRNPEDLARLQNINTEARSRPQALTKLLSIKFF